MWNRHISDILQSLGGRYLVDPQQHTTPEPPQRNLLDPEAEENYGKTRLSILSCLSWLKKGQDEWMIRNT